MHYRMWLVPLYAERERTRIQVLREKVTGGHSNKAAKCKPRTEASGETNPAHTLISDFQPPELWENKLLLFKPPSVWYFVMEALAESYTM